MIVLVDLTDCPADVPQHWIRSDFLGRIGRLGGTTLILDPEDCSSEDARTVASFVDVIDHASSIGCETVVVVNGAQVFLDEEVALNGITKFVAATPDYFSQWEHCRLPLGIGIRAFSLKKLKQVRPKSVADYLSDIRSRPQDFNFLYDDHPYASHEDSFLDSRLSPAVRDMLDAHPGDIGWGLKGFMSLSENGWADRVRFRPTENAAITDERGMPAAFGFESSACADFPTYLMFDITNQCNAKCIHCPHSLGFDGMENSIFLDFDVYTKVIDEAVGKPLDFVRFTADGEPLLHPRLFDMLDYAMARDVGPIGLTTNGSALNDRNVKRVLDSEIFMVDISLDGFSEKTYEVVRAGLSYKRTIDNVHRLINRRNERTSPLKIVVSFVVQEENAHELDGFKKFWDPLVDMVLVREMISNVGINEVRDLPESIEKKRWPCPHFFRRVVVTYDGRIKACPIDWQNGSVYTSLSQTSVGDAWHSEFYRRNRLEHLNNDFSPCSICKGCRDWQGTPWHLGYEKVARRLGSVKVED